MNPVPTIRQSKIIANHETIVNQTELMSPSNTLIKRVVYHTPAIIETVVDMPQQIPHSNLTHTHRSSTQPLNFTSIPGMKRIQSYTSPHQHIDYLPHPRYISRLGGNYAIGNNLKVSQDLRGFRQYNNVSQGRSFTHKQVSRVQNKAGFCDRVLGFCWGNKCPWWLLLLIPVLIILFILMISYFINRHRIFYGYDTTTPATIQNNALLAYPSGINNPSTITQQQQNITSFNPNLNPNLNPHLNPNLNPNMIPQTVTTQQQSTFTSPPQPLQPQIVPPIVSTTVNPAPIPYNQPLIQSNTTEIRTNDITGDSIYNKVNTLRSQPGYNPSYPLIPNPNNINQIRNTQIVTNTNNLANPLQMAPTIEQVETKAMIEADRYNRQIRNSRISPLVQHHHLRHSLS